MPQDVLEFALSSRMTTSAGIQGESRHVWLEVLVLKLKIKQCLCLLLFLRWGCPQRFDSCLHRRAEAEALSLCSAICFLSPGALIEKAQFPLFHYLIN